MAKQVWQADDGTVHDSKYAAELHDQGERNRVAKNIEKFLTTYSGSELLKKYKWEEFGTWEVRGEDPNCDFGGPHAQPRLGFYTGKLKDVVATAVELPHFWSWGAGGSIWKIEPTSI